jgi:hypothetical protein
MDEVNSLSMFRVSTTTDSFLISKSTSINMIRRDEIIDVVKQRFVEKLSVNLPVFGIEKPHLKEFTTTEKDAKRG